MSSVLQFSPAFKSSLSLGDFSSAPNKSSRKRKRGLESYGEGPEADSNANGTSIPSSHSNTFFTAALTAPNVTISHDDDTLQYRNSSRDNYEELHGRDLPRFPTHHIVEPSHLVCRGQISDELATLKPPLYVAPWRLPNTTAENMLGNTCLRQHHLNIITAILHRCLSEGDYVRAGRAWAMLLRAEQSGHSVDLRTHDRWGIGAEILLQRESQRVQKTLTHKAADISSSTADPNVNAESMEKAKEYYEWVVLQYPYRKAFPKATGSIDVSIALLSLWIYSVKEQASTALIAYGNSAENVEETDSEANDDFQRSFAPHKELDRYRNCEQIRRDTLQSAQDIGARLDALLVAPPFSDFARFWKLRGEVSLWIADLSVPSVFSSSSSDISAYDEDLIMKSPSLSREVSGRIASSKEYRLSKERQHAFARAKEAFERAKALQ